MFSEIYNLSLNLCAMSVYCTLKYLQLEDVVSRQKCLCGALMSYFLYDNILLVTHISQCFLSLAVTLCCHLDIL